MRKNSVPVVMMGLVIGCLLFIQPSHAQQLSRKATYVGSTVSAPKFGGDQVDVASVSSNAFVAAYIAGGQARLNLYSTNGAGTTISFEDGESDNATSSAVKVAKISTNMVVMVCRTASGIRIRTYDLFNGLNLSPRHTLNKAVAGINGDTNLDVFPLDLSGDFFVVTVGGATNSRVLVYENSLDHLIERDEELFPSQDMDGARLSDDSFVVAFSNPNCGGSSDVVSKVFGWNGSWLLSGDTDTWNTTVCGAFLDGPAIAVSALSNERFVVSTKSSTRQYHRIFDMVNGNIVQRNDYFTQKPTDIDNTAISANSYAVASRVNDDFKLSIYQVNGAGDIAFKDTELAGFVYQLSVDKLFHNSLSSRLITAMVDSNKKLRLILWDSSFPLGGDLGFASRSESEETNLVLGGSDDDDLFKVYPNPAIGSATFQLNLDASQKVRVQVLNHLGMVVGTVYEGTLAKGVHDIAYDVSGLSAGQYVVMVESETEKNSHSLVVSH